MNQLKFLSFFAFISVQLIGQQVQEVEFNYLTELPFQTSQDSEYFHLETTMMIRGITNDIFNYAKQYKDQKSDVLFKLNFKSKTGASVSIDYAVDAKSRTLYFSSTDKANLFKKDTYNWINRSFRSNIPFED